MCRDQRRSFLLQIILILGIGYVCGQPAGPLPSVILDSIGNVASSATNFLANAVERPRNLIANATRATTGYIDSATSRGLELKMRRILEKFRARMPNGIPELGVPPLEPFELDQIYIETNNPQIGNINLVIDDLVVKGLSTFRVDRARLSLVGPTITLNLLFPAIYANGDYNVSGILGNTFPIHGSGPFQATIYDFRLFIRTVIGYSRGMYLRSLNLDFSLDSISIKLDNFMGGDAIGKIMNQVFEELTPEAVNIVKPDVLPVIEDYVGKMINETLKRLTTKDVVGVVLGLGENEIRDIAQIIVP